MTEEFCGQFKIFLAIFLILLLFFLFSSRPMEEDAPVSYLTTSVLHSVLAIFHDMVPAVYCNGCSKGLRG